MLELRIVSQPDGKFTVTITNSNVSIGGEVSASTARNIFDIFQFNPQTAKLALLQELMK